MIRQLSPDQVMEKHLSLWQTLVFDSLWACKIVFRTKSNPEFVALSATPVKLNIAGQWTACDQDANGGHMYRVDLEQYGTAVYGSMHSQKEPAGPTIHLRGIIVDDRLVANTWVDRQQGMGSGTLDLNPNDNNRILAGNSSWFSVMGDQEYRNTVWKKQ